MKNTSTFFNLEGGGRINNGEVTNVGIGYLVPSIKCFNVGFKYERTDGRDWNLKIYDDFQKNDILLLIKQNRVRISIKLKQ